MKFNLFLLFLSLYIFSGVGCDKEETPLVNVSIGPASSTNSSSGSFSQTSGLESTLAPDFTQNDVNDNPVTLSSFRGKYVLLNFWGSKFATCLREAPFLVAAYERFKNRNFTILSISIDTDKAKWQSAFLGQTPDWPVMPWTHVTDFKEWKNAVAKLYKVNGLPRNILINPEGKIIATGGTFKGDEWTNYLDKTLPK